MGGVCSASLWIQGAAQPLLNPIEGSGGLQRPKFFTADAILCIQTCCKKILFALGRSAIFPDTNLPINEVMAMHCINIFPSYSSKLSDTYLTKCTNITKYPNNDTGNAIVHIINFFFFHISTFIIVLHLAFNVWLCLFFAGGAVLWTGLNTNAQTAKTIKMKSSPLKIHLIN